MQNTDSGGYTNEYYYTADIVDSTIAVTNSAGTTAAGYTYDSYGNITATTGGTFATTTNPWRYGAGYTDPNGTIKLGARYYNTGLGRFTQPDPSGQEKNCYAYAGENPITKSDSSGFYPCVAQPYSAAQDDPNNYDGCVSDPGSCTDVNAEVWGAVAQGVYEAGQAVIGCAAGMATYASSGLGTLVSIIPGVEEGANAVACAAGADLALNGGRNALN